MSKRKCLSIAEKIKVLEDVDKGMKKKDVALRFGIPANSLSTILKNRETILKQSEEASCSRKRIKLCLYDDVDEALLKWIQMIRNKNVPLSGPLIKEKALEYAKSLGHSQFQASAGWLDKFKRRHGIMQKVISGESADVSEGDCVQWEESVLKKILEDYEPKDIFNADETGLFFKCLPNKTLTFKSDKCFGGKHSKERVTVMIAANMTGKEKLKLLVIGKSKNPRCFKGVKSLEVDYDFNKKAWMTSHIFEEWLVKLDKHFAKRHRKIVLIVDNCPAHPHALIPKMKSIKLVFLPPNTTSRLQPMDQGVIKNLKFHYRKRILKKNIMAIEKNQPVDKIVDLRECISELAKAWQYDVTESTIENCFSKAGFTSVSLDSDEEDGLQLSELKKSWQELRECGNISGEVELEDFLAIDDEVAVAEYPSDADILDSVRGNPEVLPTAEEEEDEENESDCLQKPSQDDVIKAFEMIRRGLQFMEDVPDDVFRSLHRCEAFYEQKTIFKCTVQHKITDYFST